jgi:hypothetical protein
MEMDADGSQNIKDNAAKRKKTRKTKNMKTTVIE